MQSHSVLTVIFSRLIWISRYQNVSILNFVELRMMEVAVITGAITRAKLQIDTTNKNAVPDKNLVQ